MVLLTLSSECASVGETAACFGTILANPLEIQAPNNGQNTYGIQLEGLNIKPWPKQTVILLCNICSLQPYGSDYRHVLAMIRENENILCNPIVAAATG